MGEKKSIGKIIEIRCEKCNKKLLELAVKGEADYSAGCPKCKTLNCGKIK